MTQILSPEVPPTELNSNQAGVPVVAAASFAA